MSTVAPAPAGTRTTVPSRGARSSFCIFMASTARRVWPTWTVSPTATATDAILPGMMARISRGPPAAPAEVRSRDARSRRAALASSSTSNSKRQPSTTTSTRVAALAIEPADVADLDVRADDRPFGGFDGDGLVARMDRGGGGRDAHRPASVLRVRANRVAWSAHRGQRSMAARRPATRQADPIASLRKDGPGSSAGAARLGADRNGGVGPVETR